MGRPVKFEKNNISHSSVCRVVLTLSYIPGSLVNTRQIDTGNELESGRAVWIFGTAMDLDTVYPILMGTLDSH